MNRFSKKKSFVIDAYTAKYYSGNNLVNVMFEQKNYLLENIEKLEKLFETFSDYKICVEDVKRRNTVSNRNEIIIIDPDLFYIFNENASKDFMSLVNKRKLLELVRSIMVNSESGEVDFKVNDKTNITNEVATKLKYVKKPIYFFSNTTNRKGKYNDF